MTKAELLAELAELKHDKPFGILTRPAIAIEYRKSYTVNYVIFIDLDGIHELNNVLGYAAVDKKIKRALRIRHDDLALSGRWASGDELIFCVRDNPADVCKRLLSSLKRNGLSGTIAYTHAGRNLEKTVKKCSDRVQQAKRENQRSMIFEVKEIN